MRDQIGMVSGDRQRGFREGWAVKSGPGGTGGRAHYFRRHGVGLCISACQEETAAAGHLYAPGSFVRCEACLMSIEERSVEGSGEPVDGRKATAGYGGGSEEPEPA